MNKEVVIYTFKTCPYCIKAKDLLKDEGIDFKEVEISRERSKLDELEKDTGCSTVPQVFVNNDFIGGCDDIVALHKEGKFDKIFK